MSKVSQLAKEMGPRVVSLVDLRKQLGPFMEGIPWAADALHDLWMMGAPDPNPSHHPCDRKRLGCWKQTRWGLKPCEAGYCKREKRLLLPTQFTEWWTAIAERIGLDYTPAEILELSNYAVLRDPRRLDNRK